jgi:potassium-transporting ATPase ATP-binding subunit
MSGVDIGKRHDPQRRGGIAIEGYVKEQGGKYPEDVRRRSGFDFARGGNAFGGGPKERTVLGVIHLKDIVKGGIQERFAELRRMGIKTVMITGDNPLTAAAIAAEAGVDDFLAQATP